MSVQLTCDFEGFVETVFGGMSLSTCARKKVETIIGEKTDDRVLVLSEHDAGPEIGSTTMSRKNRKGIQMDTLLNGSFRKTFQAGTVVFNRTQNTYWYVSEVTPHFVTVSRVTPRRTEKGWDGNKGEMMSIRRKINRDDSFGESFGRDRRVQTYAESAWKSAYHSDGDHTLNKGEMEDMIPLLMEASLQRNLATQLVPGLLHLMHVAQVRWGIPFIWVFATHKQGVVKHPSLSWNDLTLVMDRINKGARLKALASVHFYPHANAKTNVLEPAGKPVAGWLRQQILTEASFRFAT